MKKTYENFSCENCPSKDKGIFCELEPESLREITEHKTVSTFKRGQVIFHQGGPNPGLYCVNKGKIKVSKTGADGKESIVRIASAGAVLGHRSLFSGENFTATATALEDTTVCFLEKRFIHKAIEDRPSIALHIIQKLSREMGAAEYKSASMFQKNVRERLAELLLKLAKEYGVREGDRTKLDIRLTREELASMIGTASETVIRFVSEFKEEGLIAQEGKTIFLTDETKLAEFANL